MKNKTPWISFNEPRLAHYAVGPCPYCNRLDTWLNNVPLEASCGGTEDKPHKEWHKRIPAQFNPYSKVYDRAAIPKKIEYKDCRPILPK